jgi:hypothetical protein
LYYTSIVTKSRARYIKSHQNPGVHSTEETKHEEKRREEEGPGEMVDIDCQFSFPNPIDQSHRWRIDQM